MFLNYQPSAKMGGLIQDIDFYEFIGILNLRKEFMILQHQKVIRIRGRFKSSSEMMKRKIRLVLEKAKKDGWAIQSANTRIREEQFDDDCNYFFYIVTIILELSTIERKMVILEEICRSSDQCDMSFKTTFGREKNRGWKIYSIDTDVVCWYDDVFRLVETIVFEKI